MRTASLVISLALLGALATAGAQQAAQGSGPEGGRGAAGDMDREITVRGQDDTMLPVPPPPADPTFVMPDADLERLETPVLPPIQPPAGTSAAPLPEWRVRDPAGASPS